MNYRAGNGGRKAPNKRVVVGRVGRVTPDEARRLAQELLGRVAAGDDPAGERTEARSLPTLGEACEDYMVSGQGRSASTERGYRRYAALYLGDWLSRPLDAITRRDVENRFRLLTERHGPMPANQCLSFLRSVYRRPCVDCEGLRNPVEQWLAAGGRYHRKTRKRISSPAEVLPCWRKGIEAVVGNPVHRDAFLFGLYTGMRRGEILPLRWERVDLDKGLFRVEETKTGAPLELPVTRQLTAILARRRAEGEATAEEVRGWVFPSPSSVSAHVEELQAHYEGIGRAGGAKFWFHGLRNAFITEAERELMLPWSLTKRLVNHARPSDVTEGYAADWTVERLRDPAQWIADCIDQLMAVCAAPAGSLHAPTPSRPALPTLGGHGQRRSRPQALPPVRPPARTPRIDGEGLEGSPEVGHSPTSADQGRRSSSMTRRRFRRHRAPLRQPAPLLRLFVYEAGRPNAAAGSGVHHRQGVNPDAALVQDLGGPGGVIAELAAEFTHEVAQRIRVARRPLSSYPVQQRIAGLDPPGAGERPGAVHHLLHHGAHLEAAADAQDRRAQARDALSERRDLRLRFVSSTDMASLATVPSSSLRTGPCRGSIGELWRGVAAGIGLRGAIFLYYSDKKSIYRKK